MVIEGSARDFEIVKGRPFLLYMEKDPIMTDLAQSFRDNYSYCRRLAGESLRE